MSTCSLTSAAAGICANTAHQAFLRAGCEQSHTMSPGGTCPPAAASLTGMPAKASRGRCLRGSRGGKGSLSRLSPRSLCSQHLLVSWRTRQPCCQGLPSGSYGNRPGSQPGPWRSLRLGLQSVCFRATVFLPVTTRHHSEPIKLDPVMPPSIVVL